ncbi:MAG: carbohydrate binding family 9 domain-containing protein [Bacteroidetes bacterium]|nr:carbohydrate binding family 9 domain-containing protein [Bacteroidota bacterium]HET6244461.1 DUF5916 domain-containing protein [Bacteroidia bacterium]
MILYYTSIARKTFVLLFALLFFTNQNIYAQEQIRPLRITEEIEADGILNEPTWNKAPVISEFMMISPVPGGKPSFNTEVKLLYNDTYLFVGIKLFDPEPKKMIATAMERDSDVEDDDNVVVIIDSYNDNLNGIAFATNPLGVRQDIEISQNGEGINEDFNTFWNVAVKITENGWIAEFKIPFSSLRFTEKEEVIMGFKVLRTIRRLNEEIIAPPFDENIADPHFRLDLALDIIFENLTCKKPVYFTPYIVSDIQKNKILNSTGSQYESNYSAISRKNYFEKSVTDKILSNIGADLKMGLSKNLTLDVSVNTDFAQAEVDDRIINTTRFNVFLPEKRAFFLESEDYFNFNMGPTRLFFSRNIGRSQGLIVPVLGGVRLTGQHKGFQVGALNMQTMAMEEEGLPSENFSVLRVKKELYNNGSYVGGILTNRISISDLSVSNQVAGVDYLHRINRKWFTSGAFSGTFNSREETSFTRNNMAAQFKLVKQSNRGFSHILDAKYLGEDFDPAMGFMRFNNLTQFRSGNSYSWVTENSKHIAGYKLESVLMNARNSSTGASEISNINVSPLLHFKNGSMIKLTPFEFYQDTFNFSWNMNSDIIVPAGNYPMWFSSVYMSSPATKRYKLESYAKKGDYYGGHMNNIWIGGKFNLNKYFQFETSYDYNHIRFANDFHILNQEALFETHLVTLNLNFQLNSKISMKALVQYDDMSNNFGSNFRFRYNPREGTELFIVINHGVNTMRQPMQPLNQELPLIANQSVIVKFIRTMDFNRLR